MTMHSKIFQISSEPIDKENYNSPSDYYDNSGDFADYIGDELTDERREDAIGYLADLLKDVFTPSGRDTLTYKGEEALRQFKQKWADRIKAMANELTADNLFSEQRLYLIQSVATETHLRTAYRVDIQDWCGGVAYPFGELFEWAASQLKEGDRIYIGAIIDYHY